VQNTNTTTTNPTKLYLTPAGHAMLRTPEGLGLFLDVYYGVGQWVRDDQADIWVVPIGRDAEGRWFLIYELGGDAHPFLVPVESVQ
jgi:hypothetical protein